MKKALLNGIIATAFLSPFAFAEDAEAREYCCEYQRSIRVDGRVQSGYGTACRQNDGSWMIVNSRGNVDPFEDLYERNERIVAQHQPVYFDYGPRMRPVTYYVPARPRYYYNQPGFYIGYGPGFGYYDRYHRDYPPGWYKNRHHRNHRDWDRDRDDDDYRRHRKH